MTPEINQQNRSGDLGTSESIRPDSLDRFNSLLELCVNGGGSPETALDVVLFAREHMGAITEARQKTEALLAESDQLLERLGIPKLHSLTDNGEQREI